VDPRSGKRFAVKQLFPLASALGFAFALDFAFVLPFAAAFVLSLLRMVVVLWMYVGTNWTCAKATGRGRGTFCVASFTFVDVSANYKAAVAFARVLRMLLAKT
jgi:hypothetical protein